MMAYGQKSRNLQTLNPDNYISMKALCVQTPNQLVIEERPMPDIQNPGEVLIKVKAGGICGSDMHIYHGTSSVATYPE